MIHEALYKVKYSWFQWWTELKFLVLQVSIFICISYIIWVQINFGASLFIFRLNRLDSKSQPPTFVIGHLLRISSQYIVGSYDNLKEVLYIWSKFWISYSIYDFVALQICHLSKKKRGDEVEVVKLLIVIFINRIRKNMSLANQ